VVDNSTSATLFDVEELYNYRVYVEAGFLGVAFLPPALYDISRKAMGVTAEDSHIYAPIFPGEKVDKSKFEIILNGSLAQFAEVVWEFSTKFTSWTPEEIRYLRQSQRIAYRIYGPGESLEARYNKYRQGKRLKRDPFPFHREPPVILADAPVLYVEIEALFEPWGMGLGTITAYTTPNGKVRLVVSIPAGGEVDRRWEALRLELKRQGWLGVPQPRVRETGPTMRTRDRFAIFKGLKDAHPTWSQARVAEESREELGEIVYAETVRNTYRAMHVKWERADRIR
jgi:hypothetical protein